MKKNFIWKNVALGAILSAAPVFTAEAVEVTIKAGTQVPLELAETVMSQNVAYGTIINFRCTRDIIVDDKVVIRAGEMAKGQVSRVKKNGIVGKGGEIEVNVTSISAVDGTEIYLSSSSLYDDGKDRTVVAIIFCFLIKGSNAEIPAGSQCVASVEGNTVVNVD